MLRGLTFDPAQLDAAGRPEAGPDAVRRPGRAHPGAARGLRGERRRRPAPAALAAAPVVALGAGFIGRKLIRDERQRQLTYRRQQAKIACRRYLDEATSSSSKDCLDSLRRTRASCATSSRPGRASCTPRRSGRSTRPSAPRRSAPRSASGGPPSWPSAARRDRAAAAAQALRCGRPRRAATSGPLAAGRPADRRRPRLIERRPGTGRSTRRRATSSPTPSTRLSGPLRLAIAGQGQGRQVDAAQRPGRRGAGARPTPASAPSSSPGTSAGTPRRSPPCTRTGGASSARSAARAVRWRSTWAAPVDAFDHLEVSWPSSPAARRHAGRHPGDRVAVHRGVGADRRRLLSAEDDRPPVVDAVLYLLRHTHASDVRFLESFHDDELGRGTPAQRRRRAVAGRRDRVVPARRPDGRRPRRRPLPARPAHPPPLPAGPPGRRPARPGRDDPARGGVPGARHDRRAARGRSATSCCSPPTGCWPTTPTSC